MGPVQKGGRWADFGVRLASAMVLGPIALLCLWHGGLAWTIFIAAALAGLGLEWAKLAALGLRDAGTWLIVAGLLAALALGHFALILGFAALALAAGGVGLSCGWFAAAGIPYAGVGALSLLWLRLQPVHGLYDTMFLVVVIWSTDVAAYLVGRLAGGKKLAPKISPGKTWSGSIGGLLIGGLAAAMMAARGHGVDLAALPAGFALSVFAQAGDLLESWIKRKLGVKDSGRTIPGHGGLFDRLDGFLAAAPVAAILALSVHGGLPLWG
ncbi:phosphatidate cytidylyltransferase [Acidocella sp.]|uniref:phosphatidate cytidylyltransferase n=1 Tax=Acidocella sp. TaxID=50710 RepID=UPI002602D835|nr:phosphatidate cytidylyltransferase [Acidocella sp.]MDD2794910.1 phosphatidate cytidylyltransferase [Acidocella sp.]